MVVVPIKDESEWVQLKVYRTFTKTTEIGREGDHVLVEDKVVKVGKYNEWFLKHEIHKIEPNIYNKDRPPAKNSCVIFYRPTNQFYKVVGSKREILNKLKTFEEQTNKIGFVYKNKNNGTSNNKAR